MTEEQMNLRITVLTDLFDKLRNTSSRTLKEFYVRQFEKQYPQVQDDLTYLLETLDGRHPIGWTFSPQMTTPQREFNSLQEIIETCIMCPKDRGTTFICEKVIGYYGVFIAPIVNRTLRLGIGRSLLQMTVTTPMLAKKYEGQELNVPVTVTEKLDGNRCVARYDNNLGKWLFTSRSGKTLRVEFDMTGMPTEFIYDGEIMSIEQTKASMQRTFDVLTQSVNYDHLPSTKDAQLLFNKTSGLINSKYKDKSTLVYNVFDIISPVTYAERRETLRYIEKEALSMRASVRIVPTLYTGNDNNIITTLLQSIVALGGEGIMLNINSRLYEQKRTDALLKYKEVQCMDMIVTGIVEGKGKYTDKVGALTCALITDDGKYILCEVGSGLSDTQREEWWRNPEEITDSIVQIAYHEVTQSREYVGTNNYSLRFPRLLRVRKNKKSTSEY